MSNENHSTVAPFWTHEHYSEFALSSEGQALLEPFNQKMREIEHHYALQLEDLRQKLKREQDDMHREFDPEMNAAFRAWLEGR